jgi:signal transduction histidine kinase
MSAGEVMFCHHDSRLVVLSILISMLAAFAARELFGRINEAQGRIWLAWLAGTAVVDGIGTWSMHYTAKLACTLPVPLLFDGRMVLLSLLVGISGSAAALLVVARHKVGWGRALLGGIVLGGWGISGLHYTSMAAMWQPAPQYYFSPLVLASVGLAMAMCAAAILVRVRFPDNSHPNRLSKYGSTLLRGAANPVMHYTAMAGVTFGFAEGPNLNERYVGVWSLGVLGICIVPVMVLVVGLLSSLLETVKKSRAELRSLSRRLQEAHESERRHLSRELHDQIGQALTAAKINTDVLRAGAQPELAARLNENAAILDGLLKQTRQISLDLRPPMLDDLGLVPALRWYINQQAERAALRANFVADPLVDDVPPPVRIACFRLAQEAITNVVRHAHATTLTVELSRADTSLRLIVRDDGNGFDVGAAKARADRGASLGLLGMTDRAALAGGSARIISSPGNGATIEVVLPLEIAKSPIPPQ